jgi:Holliday junction resolvase
MTANNAHTRKAKGNKYEREIAELYRRKLFPLAQRMPTSGAMLLHKGDILKGEIDEWVDECKCQETTKIWEWWKQATEQCNDKQKPVLHIKRNHSESLTIMRTEDYFKLREGK